MSVYSEIQTGQSGDKTRESFMSRRILSIFPQCISSQAETLNHSVDTVDDGLEYAFPAAAMNAHHGRDAASAKAECFTISNLISVNPSSKYKTSESEIDALLYGTKSKRKKHPSNQRNRSSKEALFAVAEDPMVDILGLLDRTSVSQSCRYSRRHSHEASDRADASTVIVKSSRATSEECLAQKRRCKQPRMLLGGSQRHRDSRRNQSHDANQSSQRATKSQTSSTRSRGRTHVSDAPKDVPAGMLSNSSDNVYEEIVESQRSHSSGVVNNRLHNYSNHVIQAM